MEHRSASLVASLHFLWSCFTRWPSWTRQIPAPGGCSGGLEPGGVTAWGGSPGLVSSLRGTVWVQLLFKKQQIENIPLPLCFLLSPVSLPQKTVSIICRASKNDVLNTAQAEALNQINSFLIPRAFEFSALSKNC